MNNSLLDEIELTDAELAGVYGADDDDGLPVAQPQQPDPDDDKEGPCVNIYIICRRKHCWR